MPIRDCLPATLLLLLGAACAGILDIASAPDGWQRELGWVIDDEFALALQVPDTVGHGVPFTVVVTTRGSSSCTRPAGAEVFQQQRDARIQAYDFVAPPGSACTRDLRPFPREVELRFDVVGEAVVRLVGRRGFEGDTVEVVRRVFVR
jgi:hypothetical protein